MKMAHYILTILCLLFVCAPSLGQEDIELDHENVRILQRNTNSENLAQITHDNHRIVTVNSMYDEVAPGYSDGIEFPQSEYKETILSLWNVEQLFFIPDFKDSVVDKPATFPQPEISVQIDQSQRSIYGPIISGVGISPDNEWISIIIRGQLRIYQLDSLELVHVFDDYAVSDAEWSSNSRKIAFYDRKTGNLIVWDIITQAIAKEYEVGEVLSSYDLMLVTNNWIIDSYELFYLCPAAEASCQMFEPTKPNIDRSFRLLALIDEQHLDVVDVRNVDPTMLQENITLLDLSCHSPDYRYICIDDGIWDIQERDYFRHSTNRHFTLFEWLPQGDYYIELMDFGIIDTEISLLKAGEDTPTQKFVFGEILKESRQILWENMPGVPAGPLRRGDSFANIWVDQSGRFMMINFTWTVLFMPIKSDR